MPQNAYKEVKKRDVGSDEKQESKDLRDLKKKCIKWEREREKKRDSCRD